MCERNFRRFVRRRFVRNEEVRFSGGIDAAVTALSKVYSSGAESPAAFSINVFCDDDEKAKEGLLGAMTAAKISEYRCPT